MLKASESLTCQSLKTMGASPCNVPAYKPRVTHLASVLFTATLPMILDYKSSLKVLTSNLFVCFLGVLGGFFCGKIQ